MTSYTLNQAIILGREEYTIEKFSIGGGVKHRGLEAPRLGNAVYLHPSGWVPLSALSQPVPSPGSYVFAKLGAHLVGVEGAKYVLQLCRVINQATTVVIWEETHSQNTTLLVTFTDKNGAPHNKQVDMEDCIPESKLHIDGWCGALEVDPGDRGFYRYVSTIERGTFETPPHITPDKETILKNMRERTLQEKAVPVTMFQDEFIEVVGNDIRLGYAIKRWIKDHPETACYITSYKPGSGVMTGATLGNLNKSDLFLSISDGERFWDFAIEPIRYNDNDICYALVDIMQEFSTGRLYYG